MDFPTHGMGGIVATVFTGVFAQTGLIAWTHAGFMEFVAAVVGVARSSSPTRSS